jgi:uncharacterized protein YktA (UPF0223 family)
MNRFKVHSVVEYIKIRNEFPFDVDDVTEHLEEVLHFFGLVTLADEETGLVKEELLKLALEEQNAEVVRLAGLEER